MITNKLRSLNTFGIKGTTTAVLLLGALSTSAQAANCQSAYNQFSGFWKDVEPVLIEAGCDAGKVAAAASGQVGLSPVLASCEKIVGGAAKLRKAVGKAWNKNAHNWSKIGARPLVSGEKADGNIISTACRMYISPESLVSDSVTIEINERDGKNKTSVVFCVQDAHGMHKREERWFNDSKDKKKKKETRKVTLNNVKGKLVTVHMDGKSVANSFKYTIKSKGASKS